MLEHFNMTSVVGELNQPSDSSLASKSTKTRAPMDVLPLNSPTAEKNDEVTAKCNHFSIRGYVSEVRKRDPKLCYPFSLKGSSEPLSIELPPMVVPKFRWWKCVGCVPEIAVNNNEAQETVVNAADDAVPAVVESSNVDVPILGNPEANVSTDSNVTRNHSPINVLSDPKDKGKGKAHVEDEPTFPTAWQNGFLKDLSQGNLPKSNCQIEVRISVSTEEVELGSRSNINALINYLRKDRVNDAEAGPSQGHVNLNGNDAEAGPSQGHVNLNGNEAEAGPSQGHVNLNGNDAEAGPSQGHVILNGNDAIENCQAQPQAGPEERPADLPANNAEVEVAAVNNEPANDRRDRVVDLPDLNECSGEPLCDENVEPLTTTTTTTSVATASNNNDVSCEDDDDYLGAERRKNPKVRLLSDLLGMKETQSSSKGRKKNPSLTSSLDESVKRKKVGSQDEGSKSVDIRVPNNGTKRMAETAEISRTESEDASDSSDESMDIISKAFEKRRCKPRIPLLEKRNKKSKFDDGSSSLSRHKVMSRSAEKGKSAEVLPRKADVSDQLVERSSVMTKKRGRLHQSRKEAGSAVCKNRNPKDSAVTQTDDDAEKMRAQKAQKSSDIRKSLTKKNSLARDLPGEDRPSLPSSQAEPMLVDGSSAKKHQDTSNNVGEASVNVRANAIGSPNTGNPFDGNGERSNAAKTNLNEKQAMTPEAEGGSSVARDVRLQVPSSNENRNVPTTEVRGLMRDFDINSIPTDDKVTEQGAADVNSIPTDDKVTEQGAADDIPMEIVELMAKNQYERRLEDPKEKQHQPPPSGISGRFIRDTNGSYEDTWQRFRQPNFLSMQTPVSADARNHVVNNGNGHIPDLNRNSMTVPNCLPRDTPVSGRFLSLSQGQEHGPPYPPCDLTLNNWNGAINVAAAQRYPSSFYQPVESYRLGPNAPRQNTTDASYVWPPRVANRMPLGNSNPQMISQGANALNKGTLHHQTSGSMLNFNAAAAAANLGKQQSLNFSNGYTVAGHPESSGGSADKYASDAVSAMHLLSLMQNAAKIPSGTKMQTATLSLGPQNMPRSTSSRQAPFMENGRTPGVQDNSRHPCYPTAIPTGRPFGPSFQSDGSNISRNHHTGFAGPIPLTLRGQRNMESPHFTLPGAEHRPQRRHLGSPLENGKDMSAFSYPSFVSNPLQGTRMKDATPNFMYRKTARREEKKTGSPIPEILVCTLNQSPRDTDDMDSYMIGPSELRPRGTPRDRSARPAGDPKKQFRHSRTSLSGKDRERQRKL